MFNFFANVFGYVLNYIYGIVNNYGIAILVFTVLLKLVMLPISINQQKTMKKTAKIQKQTKQIQAKYKNDQARMNQEIMDLYKKENMSPFSGCLSSIVQIILILSMFYLVSRPLTYMKHVDSELINKYSQEIQQEKGNQRYTEIAIIRYKSEVDPTVNINMNFLGLNLSAVPSENYNDPKVFIIPILYVVTSIISTRVTTNLNKQKIEENNETKELKKKDDDDFDMAQEMSKNMTLMMPLMTVSIALIAPLGLALYWFANNLLMLGERLVLNKFFKESDEEV